MTWVDELKSAGAQNIAARLGMTRKRHRVGPCPACGVERSSKDRRPPVGLRPDDTGWKCHACSTTGDVIDLISWALLGRRAKDAGAEFRKIKVWAEEGEALVQSSVAEWEPILPPEDEVRMILKACAPVASVQSAKLAAFLGRRGFNPSRIPAGVLPSPGWPGWQKISKVEIERKGRTTLVPWWPAKWAAIWPLVIPAYDYSGRPRSIHARAIDDRAIRKTTWPQGVHSKGLFFADPHLARPMLRGQPFQGDKILICEGLTDYLWSVQSAPERCAVIGIASGSISSMKALHWPVDAKIYIGADPDPTGDRYAAEIAAAISPILCRRIPLHILRTPTNGH